MNSSVLSPLGLTTRSQVLLSGSTLVEAVIVLSEAILSKLLHITLRVFLCSCQMNNSKPTITITTFVNSHHIMTHHSSSCVKYY